MDTCIYVAEFLHCSPKIIRTLLIGYIPRQNVFGVKKNLKSNQALSTITRHSYEFLHYAPEIIKLLTDYIPNTKCFWC